jgi:hypothetical protein
VDGNTAEDNIEADIKCVSCTLGDNHYVTIQ